MIFGENISFNINEIEFEEENLINQNNQDNQHNQNNQHNQSNQYNKGHLNEGENVINLNNQKKEEQDVSVNQPNKPNLENEKLNIGLI